ncbi:hypothetical protein S245_013554, partial [Arachis hypogaea]
GNYFQWCDKDSEKDLARWCGLLPQHDGGVRQPGVVVGGKRVVIKQGRRPKKWCQCCEKSSEKELEVELLLPQHNGGVCRRWRKKCQMSVEISQHVVVASTRVFLNAVLSETTWWMVVG